MTFHDIALIVSRFIDFIAFKVSFLTIKRIGTRTSFPPSLHSPIVYYQYAGAHFVCAHSLLTLYYSMLTFFLES